jgi:small subunit ribosomal protein S11
MPDEDTLKDLTPQVEAADAPAGEDADAGKRRAKAGRYVPSGIAFVTATFNNTKVTFTDLHGNTLCWSSSGKAGFKGSRKSTAYAAQMVATEATKKAQLLGMKEVEVRIKGPGAGRESAVRGIAAAGMEITTLKDVTPIPHNGCRPPKRRRI